MCQKPALSTTRNVKLASEADVVKNVALSTWPATLRALHEKDMSEKTTVAINMRVSQSKKLLIDTAAELEGQNRKEFVIGAACERAESVLLERRHFILEGPSFDQFEAALEQGAISQNSLFKALLERPKTWA